MATLTVYAVDSCDGKFVGFIRGSSRLDATNKLHKFNSSYVLSGVVEHNNRNQKTIKNKYYSPMRIKANERFYGFA